MVQNYPSLVNKGRLKYLRWILCMVVVILSQQSYAQQSFNYQVVIRDASGNVITNQSIGVEIILLQGSATGTNVYEETHTITSNGQGVIALAVGAETTVDSFMNIDWSTQDYWLQVGIDTTGGTNYTTLGVSQLQSVPYANYAINGPDADPTNEIELPTGGTTGQVLVTDGSGNYSWITDKVDDVDTDATNEIELPAGGTNGQVLVTDGLGNYSWITDKVDDGDTDATNEIELPTGGTTGQVLVTDGSGNYSWVTDNVNDADADATNEIELPTGGTNGQVLVTDGSGNYSWVSDTQGGFSTTNNITSNTSGAIATDDFVFGSSQLNDIQNNASDNMRMYFDKSKGAFRAGSAVASDGFTGDWDDPNVGTFSAAFVRGNHGCGSFWKL
ncbi:hypothetical protein ABW636_06780 [Aquimarina sp. 2201CG1-2-11]|uniref:hypothetical protein n=1 Tax=Aquimarina discodermiae TaxID=3231043 RepID=UPI0034620C43